MANTSPVYARINTQLKKEAESVMEKLGISPQLVYKKMQTEIFPCEDLALLLSTVDITKNPFWA